MSDHNPTFATADLSVLGGAIGIAGAASFVVLAGAPSHAVRIERLVLTGLVILSELHHEGFDIVPLAAVHDRACVRTGTLRLLRP